MCFLFYFCLGIVLTFYKFQKAFCSLFTVFLSHSYSCLTGYIVVSHGAWSCHTQLILKTQSAAQYQLRQWNDRLLSFSILSRKEECMKWVWHLFSHSILWRSLWDHFLANPCFMEGVVSCPFETNVRETWYVLVEVPLSFKRFPLVAVPGRVCGSSSWADLNNWHVLIQVTTCGLHSCSLFWLRGICESVRKLWVKSISLLPPSQILSAVCLWF